MGAGGLGDEQLRSLRRALRNYGRLRFPALHGELDDLVAQALSDLWEFLSERGGGGRMAADEVLRLAYTIFSRRAADAYRKGAQRWLVSLDSLGDSEQADPADARQRQALLYRRMLGVCAAELAKADQQDRLLLAGIAGLGEAAPGAMGARDRQRLHRLRRRLAQAIRSELGEEAQRLLREDV